MLPPSSVTKGQHLLTTLATPTQALLAAVCTDGMRNAAHLNFRPATSLLTNAGLTQPVVGSAPSDSLWCTCRYVGVCFSIVWRRKYAQSYLVHSHCHLLRSYLTDHVLFHYLFTLFVLICLTLKHFRVCITGILVLNGFLF